MTTVHAPHAPSYTVVGGIIEESGSDRVGVDSRADHGGKVTALMEGS
ncbi:hypothetical protein F383_37772 [Gossypium arboreum]|uniref:Uncharacterized protein n=1 Tax=Gossypium arboreum TaxID=29729 RepID=A0A0B0MDS7_GOSAR|nr:hypothetical protein F383_37772 [Gossypium arboreum]